ncbi:MAG: sulfurtransferase TusA family protein [Rhizomicrobium sp.]
MHRPTLDLRGLKCPMPALFARRALARADAGQALEILCDDPMAAVDVPHMCHTEGYEVVESGSEDGLTRFVLRRPG